MRQIEINEMCTGASDLCKVVLVRRDNGPETLSLLWNINLPKPEKLRQSSGNIRLESNVFLIDSIERISKSKAAPGQTFTAL